MELLNLVTVSTLPQSVFQQVEKLLTGHGITFQMLRHEPIYSSEEAARVRGTPLASGAKELRKPTERQMAA